MKSNKTLTWIIPFLIFFSCSKDEMRSNGIIVRKKAPIANAGENVTIVLPQSTTILDGTTSSDSDGTIISYQWKQITGLSSSVIEEPHKVLTEVKNLRAGTYEFELTVMDNDGLSSKDVKLVKIIPPPQAVNEIVAELKWWYDESKKKLAAKLTDLEDAGNPFSADSIKAVYRFSNGSYVEIPEGNPGNSGGIYYEIEMKTLMLYLPFQPSPAVAGNSAAIAIQIAIAIAEGGLHLPQYAKVVFR